MNENPDLMTHDELVAKVNDLRHLTYELLQLVYRQRDELALWEVPVSVRPTLWQRIKARFHSEEARDED